MIKSKRGQTLGFSIMTGIFVLLVGMMVINFLTPEITTARNNLNCASASTISDGVKLTCLMFDLGVPYWIVLIFSIMIGGITYWMRN